MLVLQWNRHNQHRQQRNLVNKRQTRFALANSTVAAIPRESACHHIRWCTGARIRLRGQGAKKRRGASRIPSLIQKSIPPYFLGGMEKKNPAILIKHTYVLLNCAGQDGSDAGRAWLRWESLSWTTVDLPLG